MIVSPDLVDLLAVGAGSAAGVTACTCTLAIRGGWLRRRARSRSARALRQWRLGSAPAIQTTHAPALVRWVARLGESAVGRLLLRSFARRLIPRTLAASATARLARAGLVEEINPEALVLGQLVVGVGLAAVYMLSMAQGSPVDIAGLGIGACLGFLAPRAALDRARRARQAIIRSSLPAAIDILAVAVAGGAVLDTAIDLYAQRFEGPLSEEFRIARKEMSLGRSRRVALQAMADRCDLEPVRGLVSAILQGERFGTPIGQTLRMQSRDIKTQRRQWVQEQLARAPVKMLLPMAGFVLPAFLIVLLGPPALDFLFGN